jgi:hypothetical protein
MHFRIVQMLRLAQVHYRVQTYSSAGWRGLGALPIAMPALHGCHCLPALFTGHMFYRLGGT